MTKEDNFHHGPGERNHHIAQNLEISFIAHPFTQISPKFQLNFSPPKFHKKIHEILASNKVRYINFIEWEVIDKHEVDNGKPKGKPREKFTYTDEMLALLT